MKRFILPVSPDPDGMVRLYKDDFHYLARVRRLKPGMWFDAFSPGGKEMRLRVLSTEDSTLTGMCIENVEKTQARNLPPIVLFQGIAKGTKMDLIIRQAAEGAVSIVVPFESEYSTVRLSKDASGMNSREINSREKNSAGKSKRWERIIREARQQSGSAVDTKIMPSCDLNSMLTIWESLKKDYTKPLGILLHHEALENGTFHNYLVNYPDLVALAVGPEGGFSPKELPFLLAAGFKPIFMGNTVLRTETAALYGTAAIRIILLESETWMSDLKD